MTRPCRVHDIHQRAELPFPRSLPEFQRLFPDDAACASYLEKIRPAAQACRARGVESLVSNSATYTERPAQRQTERAFQRSNAESH